LGPAAPPTASRLDIRRPGNPDSRVRVCVIFNPAAKGDQARHLRRELATISRQAVLKQTTCPGEAQRLATEAVREGAEIIVAAGGDGTVNEVLNGLADAPHGLQQARLAVLPLGTVNVLARELGLPLAARAAWETILRGRERRMDLPWAEWTDAGQRRRRYFAQLAGAGLDARAVELVQWRLKKVLGKFAYVLAGFQALHRRAPPLVVSDGRTTCACELALFGNGRLYAGPYRLFPEARPDDGLLDATIFPLVGWGTLLRCGPVLLARGRLPAGVARPLRAAEFSLSCPGRMPFELDGELAGHLPARLGLLPGALRVLVP